MSRPTNRANGEHQGPLRRFQLLMDSNDSDLSPEEIARLCEAAALEQQFIVEMDACWVKLRASYRAKERLQHLTASEVHDAIARSRQLLGEHGE